MYRIHYEFLSRDSKSAKWHIGMPTTGGKSPEEWKAFVSYLRASTSPLITSGRLLRVGYEALPENGSEPSGVPDMFSRITYPNPS